MNFSLAHKLLKEDYSNNLPVVGDWLQEEFDCGIELTRKMKDKPRMFKKILKRKHLKQIIKEQDAPVIDCGYNQDHMKFYSVVYGYTSNGLVIFKGSMNEIQEKTKNMVPFHAFEHYYYNGRKSGQLIVTLGKNHYNLRKKIGKMKRVPYKHISIN